MAKSNMENSKNLKIKLINKGVYYVKVKRKEVITKKKQTKTIKNIDKS